MPVTHRSAANTSHIASHIAKAQFKPVPINREGAGHIATVASALAAPSRYPQPTKLLGGTVGPGKAEKPQVRDIKPTAMFRQGPLPDRSTTSHVKFSPLQFAKASAERPQPPSGRSSTLTTARQA